MNTETLNKRKKRARIVVRELKRLFPETKTALAHSNSWELLVAVMLSAQTTDKQVNVVTKNLFKTYKTLDEYANADLHTLQRYINSVNYYKTKGKHILASARKIQKEFGSRVPKTMKDMLALPGVGRKTANVVLNNINGVAEGIAVDTHVKRLAWRFGLTDETDPKKIEQDLMKILPKKTWLSFTNQMIEYGRKYSPARKKDDRDDVIMCALKKADAAPIFG